MNNYEEALRIAHEVMRKNKPLKLKIVGSIARREQHINDIDFITKSILPNNKKYFKMQYEGYNIDIWNVEDMKIGYFLRTYPTYLLIAIRKGLKKNNCQLTNQLYCDNKLVKNPTIKEIFKLADIEYRPLSYYYKVGGIKKHKYQLQGVLFRTDLYDWTTSKQKLKEMGLKMTNLAIARKTDDYYRYRINQSYPNKYNYYIKDIGNGIKFIIGYPKN